MYLGRQIALPMMGSYTFSFSRIFVSCFAVVFRLVGLLSNMSFVFIFVVSSLCIPVHVSRTCSCDSMVSVHLQHLVSLYLPLKLLFTSSILVLALKMVFSRRNCIFVFPPLVFSMLCRKYLFSCCGLIYSFLVFCRVSLICSLILVAVSFHPPVVFVSIILVVIFSGCLCSLFSMLNMFFVMMVVMSSSPVSM